MADTKNTPDNAGVPNDGVRTPAGANKGQVHGGQQGDHSADVQHNQATTVRSSGDQNPGDACRSDRDRTDTPGINPG